MSSASTESTTASNAAAPALSDGRLPRLFSLRYSTRAISFAGAALLIGQLTFYSTETLGLNVAIMGAILLAARVTDAITDLVAGAIVDRTRTRWGKARPYELFVIPMWVALIAAFSTPDMSPFWQYAWLFTCYFLITSVAQTFLGTADGVYLRHALRGEARQAKVISRTAMLMVAASIIMAAAIPQMIVAWGDQPGGWTLISAVMGVPLMAIGLIRMLTIKELPVEELGAASDNIPSLREIVRQAVSNKYVWILGGLTALSALASGIPGAAGTYFWLYVYGDIGLASYLSIGAIFIAAMLAVFPWAVRRFGGGMVYIRATLVISIVGSLLIFMAPENLLVVAVGTILSAMSSSITIVWVFFSIQTMTYGQWKNGYGVEAAVGAIAGVLNKLGNGVAPLVFGLGLAAVGYVGGADTQPPQVTTMIIAMMSLVPASICVLMLALSFCWNLDKLMPRIEADLAARREALLGEDAD